jgi:hypothetical protein
MACKSKTFINDLGSDVVAEITSQLNTALSATPLQSLRQPVTAGGTGAADSISAADNQTISGILFMAPEDCFVTNIKFGANASQPLNAGTPADTAIVILRVPATWVDGAGATADTILRSAGVHGNVGLVALGAVGTYQVVFASTGAALTAAAGFDGNQIGELVGLPASGAAGEVLGASIGGTMIAQACANSDPVSIPAEGFAMNAGDTLVWGFANHLGVPATFFGSVGYRPVKDKITLSPDVPAKAFNSVDR